MKVFAPIFFFLTIFFSFSIFAGDSGIYFNADKDGEGIVLSRNNGRIQFFLFTYDDFQGCFGIEIQKGALASESNCHENRWFLTSGDLIDSGDNSVDGYLYTALGLNYPFGLPDPGNPFRSTVGEVHIIGLYVLQRFGQGWRLRVVRFGETLDEEDVLFTTFFEFTTPLLFSTD